MSFLDDYEPVENRLRQFWEDHPYGRVITTLEHHTDGDYIMRAEVFVGNELRNDPPTATGYAHDSADQLPANMKASALEVCETSAIGRALANMGYAPKGKRPSREEMQKASAPVTSAPDSKPVSQGPGTGTGASPSLPAPGVDQSEDVSLDGAASDADPSLRGGAGDGSATPSDENEQATALQWQRLSEICEGNATRMVNRLRKATGTSKSKADFQQTATKRQVAAAINGEVLSG